MFSSASASRDKFAQTFDILITPQYQQNQKTTIEVPERPSKSSTHLHCRSRQLSQQQLDEMREAFIIYDKDNDKKINMKELATVMRCIGFSPTQADVQKIAQDCGANHGNKLFDFNEAQSVISRSAPPPEKEGTIRDCFRIFDKDGNGFVSASELRHVLTNLGEKLTDEEVDELIREADITGDGQVNYEEFVNILMAGR